MAVDPISRGTRTKRSSAHFLALILTLIVSVTVAPRPTAAQEEDLKLNVQFAQTSFGSADTLQATIQISNDSTKPFGPGRVDVGLQRKDLSPDIGQLYFEETLPLPKLPSGDTTLTFTRELAKLGIPPGSYPFTANLYIGQQRFATSETRLSLVNPRPTPPLRVVLIWTLHERAQFDPAGVYMNQKIQSQLAAGGVYRRHLTVSKFPNMKVNFSFSPLLVKQLLDFGEGYTLKGDPHRDIQKTSPEANQARDILAEYSNLQTLGQAEVAPPPFSYPDLTRLSQNGQSEDGALQIRRGNDVIEKAFANQKPKVMMAPHGRLDQGSLSNFIENDVSAVVLSDRLYSAIAQRDAEIFQPHVLTDMDGDSLVGLFTDNVASKLLAREDPALAVPELIGRLAELYVDQPPSGRLVVVATPTANHVTNTEFLEALYGALAATNWVKTITLSEAAAIPIRSSTPLILPNEETDMSPVEKVYYERLRATRNNYLWFAELIDNEELERRLEVNLMVSESSDWTAVERGSGLFDEGLAFMQSIDKDIRNVLADVRIIAPNSISEVGKQTLKIVVDNRSEYLIRAEIRMEGENMTLKEDRRRLLITPGENELTVEATIKELPAILRATIEHAEKPIAQSSLRYSRRQTLLPLLLSGGLFLVFALGWLLLRRKARY